MASYVQGALIAGEKIVHLGHISLWSLWDRILGGVALPLAGLGVASQLPPEGARVVAIVATMIGLVFLLSAYIAYQTTELAITSKRIIAKFGFISRRTVEINLAKVESLRVDQSILGRILDYGTIVVAGTGEAHAPIPNISDPMAFRRKFMEATDTPVTRERS